jgi:hypothetical protein
MSKEITKKQEQALSAIKMSAEDKEAMYGGLEQEDVTIPRIVILQGLSPEVTEGRGKPGEFFIKGLERNLGDDPVEIVILMRSKSRIRWQDLTLGGGILCQSKDSKLGTGDPGGDCSVCPHAAWSGTGKPSCDLYQNLVVVLRNDEDWFPVALSGNRTKLKAMKNLNSLLLTELAKGRPLFSKSYLLESVNKTSSKGLKYFSYRISPNASNAQIPEDEQQQAYAIYNSLKGKTIEIIQEQEKEEVQAESPSGEF